DGRDVETRLWPKRHVHYRLVRAGRPEEHGIDRITRALRADVAERDQDVVRSRGSLDRVEHANRQLLGLLGARADRRVESETELRRADARKELLAQTRPEQQQDQHHAEGIRAEHGPPDRAEASETRGPSIASLVEVPAAGDERRASAIDLAMDPQKEHRQ